MKKSEVNWVVVFLKAIFLYGFQCIACVIGDAPKFTDIFKKYEMVYEEKSVNFINYKYRIKKSDINNLQEQLNIHLRTEWVKHQINNTTFEILKNIHFKEKHRKIEHYFTFTRKGNLKDEIICIIENDSGTDKCSIVTIVWGLKHE